MGSAAALSKLRVAESLLGDGFEAFHFYEQVVKLVPGILYVYNHELQSNEYSNTSIGALLGYSPEEVLEMGANVLPQLIHPDDLPRLGVYFQQLAGLFDGETSSIDYRAIARDGSIVWLRSNDAVFERDENGRLRRHVGVTNDVTEEVNKAARLKDAYHDLQRRTAQLEYTNAELEQLTYIATHDLKGPLSNLRHLIEMLREELDPADQGIAEILGWIEASSRQAHDKLQALVGVAKVRSAELSPRVRIDLQSTARSACNVLAREIDAAQATVLIDFEAATEVFFPQFEVSSMLENLISNALKYAHPDRTPEIHLLSRKVAGGVALSIQDNGTGIDLPRDEEKVFGLFKRAHVEPAGSGIAMYTIRKLLERYEGHITVDSVEGEWAKFTLFFPNPEKES